MADDLFLELARFVERVTAIARTGLAFKPDGFDAERYGELLQESARMVAALEGLDSSQASALQKKWREMVIAGFDGYVTPATGCGIIAFNDRDELLMLKRLNERWWYPTGFCEVGLTPAENAAKEAIEETGLLVEPMHLMAVMDSRKMGSPRRHIYQALFYCRISGGALKVNELEALDGGFFPLDSLPEPLHMNDRRWLELARQFHFDKRRDAFFDRV